MKLAKLKKLNKFLDLSVSHKAISLFRIILYSSFIFNLQSLLSFKDFSVPNPIARIYLLPFLFVCATFALIGFKTRVFSIGFFFGFYWFSTYTYDWYEPDSVMSLFSLLACFAPYSTQWSFDSLFLKRKFYPPKAQMKWFLIATLVVEITLYFQAGLAKLQGNFWPEGIAIWLAGFVPYMVSIELPAVFQSQIISYILSWSVILYECFFFLILIKPFRKAFVIYGLILHVGIALVTPLTAFGIMMTAPLFIFLPLKEEDLKVEMQESFHKWKVYPVVLYSVIVFSSFLHMKLNENYVSIITRFVGVHPNGYYHDGNFFSAGPFYRLEISHQHSRKELPSFDLKGHPTVSDREWKRWGFFVRNGCIQSIEDSIYRYENICKGNCKIHIYAKDMSVSRYYFNPEIIADLKARDWTKIADITFNENKIEWYFSQSEKAKKIRELHLRNCL